MREQSVGPQQSTRIRGTGVESPGSCEAAIINYFVSSSSTVLNEALQPKEIIQDQSPLFEICGVLQREVFAGQQTLHFLRWYGDVS